jgi:tRNA pseudouridine55 synthase
VTRARSGLLVVDKPAGWTSHDVVARARRLCGTKRVGHAGTLDPMATGVLVLGVERGTKLLTFLVGCDKEYHATVRLGLATLTDDAEGEVTAVHGIADLAATEAALPGAVSLLTGSIEQVPSAVSAIKIGGERAYAKVRKGDAVNLVARPVTVSRFDVLATRAATAVIADGREVPVLDVDVAVEVSSGTYVRALARDLGAALGVGGHLTALRRTRVGRFDLSVAAPFADLIAQADERRAEQETRQGTERGAEAGTERLPIIPLAEAARAQLPVHAVSEQEAVRLGHGQRIPSGDRRMDAVAAIDPAGRLVAVLDETGPTARARVVFATD